MSGNGKLFLNRNSLSWLLIVSILLVTLLPAHYHLNSLSGHHAHSSTTTSHSHVTDLHVLTEKYQQLHHDEATSITASPDGIVKNTSPDFSPFVLLVMVLLLPLTLNKLINRHLYIQNVNLKQYFPHFTPLLRAPPLRTPYLFK